MENSLPNEAELLSMLSLNKTENSVTKSLENGKSVLTTENGETPKRRNKPKPNEFEDNKIRVGKDFQAVCPELIPAAERNVAVLNEHALIVWSPQHQIPEENLQGYTSKAREKYGYNTEQSLAMLWWHKYNLETALADMKNFSPFPDEWTREDKVIFEEAVLTHGKNFHRIRELLPDKSIGEVVNYYYTWRKKGRRQRFLDRQAKNRH